MTRKTITALVVFAIFAFTAPVAALDYTTPPSPYFVHDTEVFFFEFYDSIMATRKPFKLGGSAILTAQQYLAGLLCEVPVYKTDSGQSYTIMAGYAFQASGDGNPDIQFLASNNIAATHIAALSWYGKKNYLRAGYIYGTFTLDDDGVYLKNGKPTPFDGAGDDYYNYAVRELDASNGYNRLYKDPDVSYHRLLAELDWDLDFLVLKALVATSIVKAPAFSRTATELSFWGRRYMLTPYFCSTMDVEGEHKFSAYQGGVFQRLSSRALAGSSGILAHNLDSYSSIASLWRVQLDANYTRIPETAIAEGRNDVYVKLEFLLAMLSAQGWWNQESGFGAGGGVNYYADGGVRLWWALKYNSFAAMPLYKRVVNEKGYSFEWGCMMAM